MRGQPVQEGVSCNRPFGKGIHNSMKSARIELYGFFGWEKVNDCA
jgi:hypothetical protein